MILNRFKNKRIKKKIDKELVEKKTTNFIQNEKVKSILVFLDKPSDNKSIRSLLAKKLSILEERITILFFINNLPNEVSTEKYLCKKDFGIFGSIKRPFIKEMIDSEYDLLLNLTKENLFFDAFASMSKAKFKVSVSANDNRMYDFIIDTDDFEIFSAELKKYLTILNKL